MGQLFTRLSTGWSDQQTTTVIARNNFVTIKSNIVKRKYSDDDGSSRKRRVTVNNCVSFAPMILFRCQLCGDCFACKDYYLDHLSICAIERQASIKVVRARSTLSIS